jgi:hypothetical protein
MAQISLKSLMSNSAPTYAAEVAQPFRDELTEINFKEMLTPSDVDAALNKQDDKGHPCCIKFCLRVRSTRRKTRSYFFALE